MRKYGPVGTDFEDYVVDELKDPETAATYLMVAIEDNDLEYFKLALSRVAKAHGITTLSEVTKIPRPTLYKMLGPDGNPSLAAMQSILSACGLTFGVMAVGRPKVSRGMLSEVEKEFNDLSMRTQRLASKLKSPTREYSAPRKKK